MKKVLLLWEPFPALKRYLLQELASTPVELIIPDKKTDDHFIEQHAPQADVILGWRPTDRLFEIGRFDLFINPGAGVQDHIERFRKLERPVTLVNGHGNADFTAQHTVALLLALTNKILPHHDWMRQGRWRTGDKEAKSLPLRDRRIGLLGFGHIQRHVLQMLSGFDCPVYLLRRRAWTTQERNTISAAGFFAVPALSDFVQTIDTLIVAVPKTKASVGMIDEAALRALGPAGLVVNVGRGAVIEEAGLYRVLKDEAIAGAAIDVWYDYKPEEEHGKRYPYSHPFHELPNVVLSPHRAASPMDDLRRWEDVTENIKRYAAGRTDLLNRVNLDAEY